MSVERVALPSPLPGGERSIGEAERVRGLKPSPDRQAPPHPALRADLSPLGRGEGPRFSFLTFAAAALLFSTLSPPARASPCALGAATYRPAEGEAATLRFAAPATADDSAFGFAMTLGSRGAYRFRMVAASGAGESYAELVEDKARMGAATPGGRIGARSETEAQDDDAPASPIHFFDERFRRAEPENLDAPAPAAVFLPELQRAFAYWSARPNADAVPTAGMWLRECGR